jgi:hypothetical protein
MLSEGPITGRWYVAENFMAGFPEITADNWKGGVQFEKSNNSFDPVKSETDLKTFIERKRSASPIPALAIRQQSAQEAYELVLAQAGAILPKRDPVDLRIIEHVRTGIVKFGKNGIITTPEDVGGWPEYKSAPAPLDTDHDGMPDEWEKKYGLDPNDPSDAAKDLDGDGYTNLEEYLNGTDPTKSIDYSKPENNLNTLK